MVDFRVDLSVFRGPLDLLLYLVRKHELAILDIPIATIADQYLEYLSVLQELDVDAVGDFLAMAATLVEIKSQECLPRGDEVEEDIEDPRQELIQRLLEYKHFRDAASILEEQSRLWQQQYPRMSSDLASRERDLAEEPVQEIELWDLISALARILRNREMAKPSNIVYDETPIHVYMTRIMEMLGQRGRIALGSLFEPGMVKSRLIGIFLAVLELVRHHQARVEQNDLFSEIWLAATQEGAAPMDFSQVDNYDHARS
jgi:segregation and condensation protein A